MTTDKESLLFELAGTISDEETVDWEKQDDDEDLLSLRQVENLASVFRDLRSQAGETAENAESHRTVAFIWGHLKVLDKIGDGSFGEVYRAWDPVLDREVALKLRRLGPPGRAPERGSQYIREARRLARLRHPNVLAIHGVDIHDGRVGLWTELVEGRTLDRCLEEDGLMCSYEAVLVGLELCRALAAVHGAGLVHGDVKAANVIREKGGRLVLADLGAATEITVRNNPGEGVYLSPLTTAPEVLEGKAPSPGDDLYCLGVLMFRLLSNAFPVEAKDLKGLRDAHMLGRRRSLRDLRPDLPGYLVRVVERAIAADPGERYASADAMERDLDTVFLRECTGSETLVAGSGLRNPPWVMIGAASVVIGLALLVVILGGLTGDPAPRRMQRSLIEARTEPAAVELAASALQPAPLELEAALFRQLDGTREPVFSGDSVGPGDQLFMEVRADEAVHLYVFSGNQDGAFYVLFPLPGLDTANPLAGSTLHRLPGRRLGVVQNWHATTVGSSEAFVVVASRRQLVDLERELNRAPARADTPTRGPTTTVLTREALRVVEANLGSDAVDGIHLDKIYRRFVDDGNVWVHRFVLLRTAD